MANPKKPLRTKKKPAKRSTSKISARTRTTAALLRKAEAAKGRNLKKARALIKQIRALLSRIESDFHKLGLLLHKLSSPTMYTSLGYARFAELLKGEKLIPQATAYRLMAVAESYRAQDVKRMGAAKAYALLAYADATPAADVARDLAKPDARIGRRKVSTMSVRDINAVAKKTRAAAGKTRERTDEEKRARAAARKLQARLRKQGLKKAKATAARKAGVWGVSIALSTDEALALGA